MRMNPGRTPATLVLVATALLSAACSSNGGSNDSPTVGAPSPAPTGRCATLTNLMRVEQVIIVDLQAGRLTDASAEPTITGINGKLAQAAEQAGRSSVLGIALTQLTTANGTLSQALNQSVPAANLGSLTGTINQDITNVENNCHDS